MEREQILADRFEQRRTLLERKRILRLARQDQTDDVDAAAGSVRRSMRAGTGKTADKLSELKRRRQERELEAASGVKKRFTSYADSTRRRGQDQDDVYDEFNDEENRRDLYGKDRRDDSSSKPATLEQANRCLIKRDLALNWLYRPYLKKVLTGLIFYNVSN